MPIETLMTLARQAGHEPMPIPRVPRKGLGGLEESSYHLAPGEKIGEATNRAWNRLQAAWANFQSAREKLAATDTKSTGRKETR